MAKRMVGLIGAGRGPRICIAQEATNVLAKVSGLLTGKVLVRHKLRHMEEVGEQELTTDRDQLLFLIPPAWVEFENVGSSRVICTVEHA